MRLLLVVAVCIALNALTQSCHAKLSYDDMKVILSNTDPVGNQYSLPKGRVLMMASPYAAHCLPVIRLGQELAARGHNVTFTSTSDFIETSFGDLDWERLGISWHPAAAPTLTPKERQETEAAAYKTFRTDPAKAFREGTGRFVKSFNTDLCRALLTQFKRGDFDLLMGEVFTTCMYDLSEAWDVPVVQVHILHLFPVLTGVTGHPWLTPLPLPPITWLPNNMNLLQMMQNIFVSVAFKLTAAAILEEAVEAARAEVGVLKGTLHATAAARPPPLVLVVAPRGMELPMSLPPNMHLIGNAFFDSSYFRGGDGGLPLELKDWLDQAAAAGERVLYVSFGTVVEFTDEQCKAILGALASLPAGVRALWVARGAALQEVLHMARASGGLPAHLRVEQWVPQFHALQHPAVVAALTHGGFSTAYETIYFGKPQVMVPVFGDNDVNAARISAHGGGIRVEKDSPSLEQELTHALHEILSKPSYAQAAAELGLLVRTAPGPAHAAQLIEQVIALGSTKHLDWPRTAGLVFAGAIAVYAVLGLVLARAALWLLVAMWRLLLRVVARGAGGPPCPSKAKAA